MPNTNFISNLLEIKDLNIINIENVDDEIHIYFRTSGS